ncbi:MAG: site-specific integrase, partial [bacterium]
MNIEEAEKLFLSNLRRNNYSSRTIEAYRFDLSKFREFINKNPQNDEILINNISPEIIKSWIDYLLENRNSYRTISRKIATIKSTFKYLMQENLLRENPCEHIKLPRLKKRLPVVLSQDEVRQIIDSINVQNNS